MSITPHAETTLPVVDYKITDQALAQLKKQYAKLPANTPVEYKTIVAAIADIRTRRTTIEKMRKNLKSDALAYGKKIDNEAKRVTALLFEIEDPLKATKQAVDDEKERTRLEAIRVEQDRVDKIKALIDKRFGMPRVEGLAAESSTLIRARLAAIEGHSVSEDEFQEFTDFASQAKIALVACVNTILADRIIVEDAENERIAEDARQAAVKAEQDKERETLAAERRQLEKEKEELAAEKAKIQAAQETAPPAEEQTAGEAAGADIEEKAAQPHVLGAEKAADGPEIGQDAGSEGGEPVFQVLNEEQAPVDPYPRKISTELQDLMAQSIGVDPQDFDEEVARLMITIGKGCYWSEELHGKARMLAHEFGEEFMAVASMSD